MAGKNEVPRYGIHNGIKFSPRRTLLRVCPICNDLFIVTGTNKSQKYCSRGCKSRIYKQQMKDHNKKNNPNRDFDKDRIQRRNYMRNSEYNQSKSDVGKIKLDKDGTPDWDAMLKITQREKKKLGL